jgi:hypothetical protein
LKRARATGLLTDMLARLETPGWPLDLVDSVHVFGSYARGAEEPHDVDVVVDNRRDERLVQEFVTALSYSRDPHASLKRALKGTSRGLQIQFDQLRDLEAAGIELTLLWRRGDTQEQALARLAAITPDPSAGRAPRDDMIQQFEGLDRWIPRQVRGDLVTLLDSGAVTIERLELPDATPREPVSQHALRRWKDTSPLRRAAAAVLSHLENTGGDLGAVHLHGQRLVWDGEDRTQIRIGFGMQHIDQLEYHLESGHEWIEVIRPTRAQPLHALRITVQDRTALATARGR